MLRRSNRPIVPLAFFLAFGLRPAIAVTAVPEPVGAFLTKHCTSCHGGSKPKADLNLTAFADEDAVLRARKVWGRVREYVQSGEMPPEGKNQPAVEEVEKFTRWIDTTLAKVDCASQADPGRVTIRRLNRSEYNHTIRDLVGVPFQPADDFPSDDVANGFDNNGDVLSLPPILLEKYLDAAEKIAGEAIVTSGDSPGPIKTWEAEDLPAKTGGSPYSEWARVLATHGAIQIDHEFPRAGEYTLRVRAFGQQAGPEPVRMGCVVDGKTLRSAQVKAVEAEPGLYQHKVTLTKGKHRFGFAFLNDFYDEKAPADQRDRNLVIDFIEVQGPAQSKNSPKPESHRRIIFKEPTKANQADLAREIIERFATRAYRRPVSPGEVARLQKFVDLASQNGDGFERGIQLAVEAILVSPQFLYRVELGRRTNPGKIVRGAGSKPPEAVPITEFELASRLSYFLWSSMPDDELFNLARDGKLRSGENLETQVRRMLRDPKAKALVENFADQWLQIRNVRTVDRDRKQFPSFDDDLRSAMIEETERFVEAVMREDRSVLDLIDADFTYVNERLARHYGMKGVSGNDFRRVSLVGTGRGGVLAQASVLTVTSNPTRTSPVKRGKWILEQILGAPTPPPPPDVPDLDNQKQLNGTLRQKMEQHRANPSCASCHARMDPLGFGFENFDAIGGWRETDGGAPVDPSGKLPTGETFRGSKELKTILRGRAKEVTHCLTEKMLTFALGRGVEYFDACAVDKIVEAAAADRYRFSRIVLEIVKSDPFQKRKPRG